MLNSGQLPWLLTLVNHNQCQACLLNQLDIFFSFFFFCYFSHHSFVFSRKKHNNERGERERDAVWGRNATKSWWKWPCRRRRGGEVWASLGEFDCYFGKCRRWVRKCVTEHRSTSRNRNLEFKEKWWSGDGNVQRFMVNLIKPPQQLNISS